MSAGLVLVLMLSQTPGIFEVIAFAIRANKQSIGHCRYLSGIQKLVEDRIMALVKQIFVQEFERNQKGSFWQEKGFK